MCRAAWLSPIREPVRPRWQARSSLQMQHSWHRPVRHGSRSPMTETRGKVANVGLVKMLAEKSSRIPSRSTLAG